MPRMVTTVDEEKLALLWATTDMSTTLIGKELGVSRTTVRRIASRLKLPERPDTPASEDELNDLADLTVEEIWEKATKIRLGHINVRMHRDIEEDNQ